MFCYSRPAVYAYVPNFVSIGLFCRPLLAKTPNFCRFWLRHLVVSPIIVSSLRKLNTGAQLQTFPVQRHENRFCTPKSFVVKSGAQTLTFKSVTNRQTNRQKTQRFWPPRWRVKSEPHQTWHGETFGGLTHSFAARGR